MRCSWESGHRCPVNETINMETPTPEVNRIQAQTTTTTTTTTGPLLIARNLSAFERPRAGDPSELIRDRFLCQGGSVLLCGGTGLGKSSLAVQLPAQFALGLGDFGINPVRPLKSLIIQAENDDGDIAEFRDGAFAGYGYNSTQVKQIAEFVVLHTEVKHRGSEFCRAVLDPLAKHHKPELVWIDHALAYYKGDASAQLGVGNFLRESLQPVLTAHKLGCFILHHSPKPSDRRVSWSDRDFSYMGMGSVEWANWARAVLTVVEVGDRIFELRCPKRGERLGWLDDKGRKATRTHIAWSNDKIFWRKPLLEEIPGGPKPKAKAVNKEDFWNMCVHAAPHGIAWKVWWKTYSEDFGGSEKSLREARDELRKDHRVYYDQGPRVWRAFV